MLFLISPTLKQWSIGAEYLQLRSELPDAVVAAALALVCHGLLVPYVIFDLGQRVDIQLGYSQCDLCESAVPALAI
jgi:hypothetical protein